MFNGDLDGVTFVLKGNDPWNRDWSQTGSTPQTSKFFEQLQPWSHYTLLLYARNTEGKHNESLPFQVRTIFKTIFRKKIH